jgi:NitT/TauT family transport system substrate-binding protein
MTIYIRFSILFFMVIASALGNYARASEKVSIQLRWLPQAQFAGYYVAAAKGFYKEEGLDVSIIPSGPNINPIQVISNNQANILVTWLGDALVARENGVLLVNVAQIFNRAGMMFVCNKAAGIAKASDLKGKRLGVWFGGYEASFFAWMNKIGLKPDSDVNVLKQGFDVDLFLRKQADCVSAMLYNEYWQVIDAGIKESDITTFFFEDQGVATLEDGLYVMEAQLKDPAFVSRMGKFLRASLKGWNYAVNNIDEAAKIVTAADKSGKGDFKIQKRQLQNVAELITYANTPKMGYMEQGAYDRTVKVLMSGGLKPILKSDPGSAGFTRLVWDASQRK